jgi:hypothetical protein
MTRLNEKITGMTQSARMAIAVALVAIGGVGGASAALLTRPPIEMAPSVVTPIAKLNSASGIVSIKGRVAEVYGDRFVVADASGRTMVGAGREGAGAIAVGNMLAVQGRYDDGQMRAAFLVGPTGAVEAVGPRGHGPHHGPHRDHGPRDDGMAPPPPGGPDAPPACAPAPVTGAAPDQRTH